MSTIKVIPRKEGDRIVCDEITSSTGDIILDAALSKSHPTLPSDSAWFEERVGQVVDVVLQGYHCKADRDGDCTWKDCPQLVEHKTHCPLDLNVDLDPEDDLIDTIYAIPPKQDLLDEAIGYISSLQDETFDGWSKDAKGGYLTACASIKQRLITLLKKQHEQ